MTGLVPAAVALVALVYATVGHAGATGYIAVMTLAGLGPDVIRPTALLLNVLVSAIGTVQFARAGHFRHDLFRPLAAASVPAAFLGGAVSLPTALFEPLLGLVLAASAARLVSETARGRPETPARPPGPAALLAIGRAAPVRRIAAVTAPFILVNSLAGIASGLAAGRPFPLARGWLVAAAAAGGIVGSQLGAFRLPTAAIRLLMAAVLLVATAKLLVLP